MFVTDASELCDVLLNEPMAVAMWMRRIWRFGGQHPSSNVLIHSLEVSHRLQSPQLKLWGLVHDVHEVLTGDCTKNFKPALLELHQHEIDKTLCDRLGIHRAAILEIKEVDKAVGDEEFRLWHLMKWSTRGELDEFYFAFERLRKEVAA